MSILKQIGSFSCRGEGSTMSKKNNYKEHKLSKFTEARKRKIIEALLLGSTWSIAASYAGIAESTLFKWLQRGKEGFNENYVKFLGACKEAQAKAALRALSNISIAADSGNWAASAWLLERRFSGYQKQQEIQPIDIKLEINQAGADVPAIIEQIRDEALTDLITGPIIDLDEE